MQVDCVGEGDLGDGYRLRYRQRQGTTVNSTVKGDTVSKAAQSGPYSIESSTVTGSTAKSGTVKSGTHLYGRTRSGCDTLSHTKAPNSSSSAMQ